LRDGVKNGSVSENRLNDAVRRILRQKLRLGLFKNPFPDSTLIKDIGSPAHRNKARQAVIESLVLLKNENKALPLNKNLSKIVVVGEHADNTGLQSGGWTVEWQGVHRNYEGATSILEGIKNIAEGEVVYDQLGTREYYDADTAIIVVGETPYAEYFGDINGETKYKLELSKKHQDYIKKYSEKVSNIIVILVSGRPLVVTKQIEQSDAFIAAWLPGSEGDGIAQVIFGEYNFKGKLPHSWPKSVKDFGKYGPNFWDSSVEPLFKFGYGLEY
ncbi:MAG: glycoside hydrolase family 3 C-terminal domain-containing protein, partial [Bacteroidia bacterium]|nr:glycoside hydrolase family 3 C-terminal domain-containing protein [Bacteroidia bacterium]